MSFQAGGRGCFNCESLPPALFRRLSNLSPSILSCTLCASIPAAPAEGEKKTVFLDHDCPSSTEFYLVSLVYSWDPLTFHDNLSICPIFLIANGPAVLARWLPFLVKRISGLARKS